MGAIQAHLTVTAVPTNPNLRSQGPGCTMHKVGVFSKYIHIQKEYENDFQTFYFKQMLKDSRNILQHNQTEFFKNINIIKDKERLKNCSRLKETECSA